MANTITWQAETLQRLRIFEQIEELHKSDRGRDSYRRGPASDEVKDEIAEKLHAIDGMGTGYIEARLFFTELYSDPMHLRSPWGDAREKAVVHNVLFLLFLSDLEFYARMCEQHQSEMVSVSK